MLVTIVVTLVVTHGGGGHGRFLEIWSSGSAQCRLRFLRGLAHQYRVVRLAIAVGTGDPLIDQVSVSGRSMMGLGRHCFLYGNTGFLTQCYRTLLFGSLHLRHPSVNNEKKTNITTVRSRSIAYIIYLFAKNSFNETSYHVYENSSPVILTRKNQFD